MERGQKKRGRFSPEGEGVQSQKLIESAKAKQSEERKTKQLEKSRAETEAKQESHMKHQLILERFDTMPEERKSELLKEFEASLAASTQAIFRKSGIIGKMLRATFAAWLIQKTDLINQ